MGSNLSTWIQADGNVVCPGVIYATNGVLDRHEAEPSGIGAILDIDRFGDALERQQQRHNECGMLKSSGFIK